MINLTVVIDNDEAIRKLRELQNVAKTTTSSVVKDSERMDASWQQMKNTLMSLTAGVSFAALAKQVVQIRGEVQQLEVAFETMLGSKEKADTLMSEIIDLAAKTPFGLQDVSNATKMLLAYGSTAEEVTGEIKMLGNIASGLSIPLNDLIYLYGTTRTQGRMFTMDLRQFMGRGIPLAEELAKQFDVTKDKVGELVTAGKVGFDDMAKALQAMSSEGGKFNNLMDKQSATISGQISNLEDAIYQMFNEIGRSSEGVISDLISGASWVVEHYQEILNVLKYVIAAYGSYKAALILVAAAQKAMALASSIKMYAQLATYITSAKDAMLLFNMAVKANPIGLLLSVLGTIGVAIWSFADGTEEATKQMGALEKAARDEYVEVNRLVATLQQGNITEQERNDILAQLKSINPDIVKGISDEADMTATLTSNLKSYNEEQIKKIQLSAIGDKQRAAITDKANAEIGVGEAQAAAENAIKQIQAALNMGELTFDTRRTNANFSKVSNAERAKIEQLITAEISRILQSGLSDIDKVKAISNIEVMTNPSNSGGYRKTGVSDVGNVNLKGIIDTYTVAEEAYKSADEALLKITEDNEQLADILGLTGKKTEENAEAVRSYAQAFTEAQEAYLSTQKELAKANADRAAGKSTISEKEYLDIKDRAELAKKEYQKLGGVTSTKEQTEKEKKAKEAAKLALELQNKADQAEIDAMAEGTEKKIAQIEHDYNLRKQAIAKEQAELIAAQGTPLTTEQQSLFSTLNRDNANTYATQLEAAIFGDVDAQSKAAIAKMKSDKAAWNEYLSEYGTFQERLKAITIKYNQAIADAQTEGERKTLEAERDAILAEYEVQATEWAKKLVDKSTNRLNQMITELQAQVEAKQAAFDALGSSGSQEAKEYLKEINELKAKIKLLEAEINKAGRKVNNGDWGDAAEVFQGITTACNEAASAVEGIDSGLASTLKSMSRVTGAVGGLVAAIATLTAASGALNIALGVIGVIAAAIQAVGTFISMLGDEYTLQDTINEAKELNKELERFHKLAQIDSVEGTIFGEDAFGNYVNNLRVMREAFDELNESREALIKKRYDDLLAQYKKELPYEEVDGGIAFDNPNDLFAKQEEVERYNALKAKQRSLETALANIVVKTRDRSGFAEFFGAQDEYAKLGDLYPELFAGGEVTLEGLRKLKESDLWGKISQENRDLIDELIADWEYYEEATEAVTEYLSDIFGELGQSISDSLLEAFKNGTDAAEAMGDATGKVIEQLAKDIAHMTFIQPLLDEAEARSKIAQDQYARGEITREEYLKLQKKNLDMLEEDLAAQQDDLNEFYENAGIDNSAPSQSATQKGFQAMSQDTGDELNGRFTDIQGKVSGIHEAVQFMKSLGSQQLQSLTSIHATVADIRNDTTLIEQHTRVLSTMSQDLSDLKRAVVNEGLI